MTFGEQLKDFRHKRGLTQAQVRECLGGVPIPTYQGWESSTRQPPEWLQGLIFRVLETGKFPPAKKGPKKAPPSPRGSKLRTVAPILDTGKPSAKKSLQ